jgi:flagellar motor switch protein FliN
MSPTPIDIFAEALPSAAAQALTEKTSGTWTFAGDEKFKPFPATTQLLTILVIAESSKAEAAIQISAENAFVLAAALGGAATAPKQFQPEHAEAVRALLAQACDKASGFIATPVKLQVVKAISWAPARQLSISGTDGASRNVQMQLLFTADWPQAAASSQTQPAPAPQTANGVNVSLLENVEIEVTLKFGERRLPLREIGELRSGSVVELDRYVQDPAELMLGDRVVARGEVVVVDGNYGLRVTEVV